MCKLSASDVIYLVNHSIHLEVLKLVGSNICDDGLIITKEADKLKYLKKFSLLDNPNITDESFVNLIKGCHNLEGIDITKCPKLTNTSLFSIAVNCPNLKSISLDFDGIIITKSGLMELFNKCPKLAEIKAGEDGEPIPDEIKEKLKRRKMLITE